MSSILNKARAHSLWQTAPTNRFSKAARRHAQVYLVDDASLKEVRGQRPDGVSVISKARVESASLECRSVLTETKNWCSVLPECSRLEWSLEAHTECRRGRAGAQRQKRGKLKLRRPMRWWLSAAEMERRPPNRPNRVSPPLLPSSTQSGGHAIKVMRPWQTHHWSQSTQHRYKTQKARGQARDPLTEQT